MKRYRLINFDFDSRAEILNMEIQDSWEEKIKEQHLRNKEEIKKDILLEFGESDKEMKIKNFSELGPSPISILAFHNKFFRQIRKSFIIGSYYPALTGVCSLGERVLNYLILKLRDYFKDTPEYKKVYNKQSFDNWELPINVLSSWGVLLPDVVKNFKDLNKIRNKVIHFNLETERNDREIALKAITIFSEIIKGQFTFFGKQPWFIEGSKGAFFIKKSYENDPFIKTVYLPNCFLVGPLHRMDFRDGKWIIIDDNKYENKEITDQEFLKRYEEVRQ